MSGDIISKITFNEKEINVIVNPTYKTVKVGDLFFSSFEDFIYYINKLTDIAEDLEIDEK